MKTLPLKSVTLEVSCWTVLLYIESATCAIFSACNELFMTVTSGEEEPLEVATRFSGIGKRKERNDESESSREKIESKRRKERKLGFVAGEPEENERRVSGQWQEESSIEEEEKEGESDGYIDDSTEEDSSVDSVEKGEEGGVEKGEEDGVEKGEEDATEGSGGEEESKEVRYCPPHIRGHEKCLQRRPAVERLQRTLQGLVNRYHHHTSHDTCAIENFYRLNDSNIQSICTQLEGMYSNHSRNGQFNQFLFSITLFTIHVCTPFPLTFL